MTAERSFVNVVQAAGRQQPVRRADVRVLPRRIADPIGRAAELDAVAAAVADGEPVCVRGVVGSGRSTVLRHAARRLAADGRPVVFVRVGDRTPGDVLQDVFEACYDAPGYRPKPGELRRLMTGVPVVVLVDDFRGGARSWEEFLDSVPDAVGVATSADLDDPASTRMIRLAGLERDDAVAMLGRLVGAPLGPSDVAAVEPLWRASGGLPGELVAIARAARRDGDGDGGGARIVWPDAARLPELVPGMLAGLTGPQRRVVTALVWAGDAGIEGGLFARIAAALGADEAACEGVVGLGIVERDGDRGEGAGGRRGEGVGGQQGEAVGGRQGEGPGGEWYRLAIDPAVVPVGALGGVEVLRIAAVLTYWAGNPALAPLSVAGHATLIGALTEAAVAAGQPETAVQLARAAAPAMACSLRADAWGRILDLGLAAATAATDEAAEAYFQNERGVRLLAVGSAAAAVAALGVASAVWVKLGMMAHAATAQHALTAVAGHAGVSAAASGSAAGTVVGAGHGVAVLGQTAGHAAGQVGAQAAQAGMQVGQAAGHVGMQAGQAAQVGQGAAQAGQVAGHGGHAATQAGSHVGHAAAQASTHGGAAAGHAAGTSAAGHAAGTTAGHAAGTTAGHVAGTSAGHAAGTTAAHTAGTTAAGHAAGTTAGHAAATAAAHTAGVAATGHGAVIGTAAAGGKATLVGVLTGAAVTTAAVATAVVVGTSGSSKPATPPPRPTPVAGVVMAVQARGALIGVDASTGTVRWRNEIRGSFTDVEDDKNVYVQSSDNSFEAIDRATGVKHWTAPTLGLGSVVWSPPVDGVLYGSGGGYVYALSSDTGKPIWSEDIAQASYDPANQYKFVASPGSTSVAVPLVRNGVVYIETEFGSVTYSGQAGDEVFSATVVAFDALKGTPRWKFQTDHLDPGSGLVMVNGEICAFGDNASGRAAFGLDAATGAKSWAYTMPKITTAYGTVPLQKQSAVLATDGAKVFVDYGGKDVLALDPRTGTKAWDHAAPSGEVTGSGLATMVFQAGHLYVTTFESSNTDVVALNPSTGASQWSTGLDGVGLLVPVDADVADGGGTVVEDDPSTRPQPSANDSVEVLGAKQSNSGTSYFALDPSRGGIRWSAPKEMNFIRTWTTQAGTTIYAINQAGLLAAYDATTNAVRWTTNIG
ncbi:PQQ-binding-like beta-propeller repeat protein [Catenulispora yoronensis]|uniref:outer membrane protein assembly factor BamB family protein n=1 Tax=Catenulispora yoronensis TaxID=450799 RepID=UPI0031D4B02F